MGAGCGGMMMGCMGVGAKPFYPALMDFPDLSPEARQLVEREAQQRIGTGSGAIASGEARLHAAIAAKDPRALQEAAASMREGLQQIESGATALRALSEQKPPREIALAWFRGQLSLPAADAAAAMTGPYGWSWYHLVAMAFLGVFVLGTLAMHAARYHRVAVLMGRLASRPPMAPAVSAVVIPVPAARTSTPAPAIISGAETSSRAWSGALRIAAIFQETHDVKTFRMVNPGGGAIPFGFLPGQFLTFSIAIDGKRVRRSYTIASSPSQTAYCEVTVKRQEHHGVSAYLHDRAKVGDVLDVAAASGRFTFTGEEPSIVLIAGGVGITPMMSVTRYLIDTSYPGDIFFLFGAGSTEDFVFREELEYLQRRHANLHIAATMARAEGTAWMGPEGPITKEFIAAAVPAIAGRHIHLCGPPPMMDALKAELAALGVPPQRVETEAFGPAAGMRPADALETDAAPAMTLAGASPGGAVSEAGRSDQAPAADAAQIRFTVSGKTGPLRPDQSVLEAAEAIGVDIDYSCRVGTCGTCRVRLLEGAVTMEVEDGLEPGDKERGIILACQAKSTGNVVVEA
jgi:ferredoxin-NADP reductase